MYWLRLLSRHTLAVEWQLCGALRLQAGLTYSALSLAREGRGGGTEGAPALIFMLLPPPSLAWPSPAMAVCSSRSRLTRTLIESNIEPFAGVRGRWLVVYS